MATPHSMQQPVYCESMMVPDAGQMHFRHSDQQNSSGGGPRPPAWASQLRCSQGLAPHDMVCPPPKPEILATPLKRRIAICCPVSFSAQMPTFGWNSS